MINIKKINKYFNKEKTNENHVIEDLDFKLDKNEYVSIMGKSGAGKTTLLNIIGCLETFDSGEYIFDNIDISKLKENDLADIRAKKISYIFQDYMLIDNDSIINNVEVPLYFDNRYKYSQYKDLAKKVLDKVGLNYLDYNMKTSFLSGGEKQRVAIARALVNEPLLILADEPTGAVDSVTSEKILNIFDEIVESGISIIVVTHDINVAKRTNKIYKMSDGKLLD